jgi:hypothetical protein
MAFFAIERAIDGVSRVRKRCGQLAIEIRIIFNDKQAHNGLRR